MRDAEPQLGITSYCFVKRLAQLFRRNWFYLNRLGWNATHDVKGSTFLDATPIEPTIPCSPTFTPLSTVA